MQIVNYDGEAFDGEGAIHVRAGAAGTDMRAYAWIVAILRAMSKTSDRMAEYLVRQSPDDDAPPLDLYVRDSRELWDRYRHLVGVYEIVATELSDSFRDQFATWQSAFLESGAGDAPVDRARHYEAHMIRSQDLVAVAAECARSGPEPALQ